jgi:solute:Na+ symporter, SSS family
MFMKRLIANRACGVCLILITTGFLAKTNAEAQQLPRRLWEDERRALLDEIRSAMKTQTGWTQIRAAEALIGQGHPEETLGTFRPLVDRAPSQERIGVWRVLAQAEPTAEGRRMMVERIWRAFLDPNGSDRVHAVEALAKLGVNVADDRRSAVEEFARRSAAEAAFARWLLTISGDASARKGLVETLTDRDPIARLRASYSLSQIAGPLSDAERKALVEAARAEPGDSPARLMVLGAAAKAGGDRDSFRTKLVEATRSRDPEWRRQAAYWLADVGAPEDLAALAALSKDGEPPVRMTAAHARLRIHARSDK